jgi:hypothetical protein
MTTAAMLCLVHPATTASRRTEGRELSRSGHEKGFPLVKVESNGSTYTVHHDKIDSTRDGAGSEPSPNPVRTTRHLGHVR